MAGVPVGDRLVKGRNTTPKVKKRKLGPDGSPVAGAVVESAVRNPDGSVVYEVSLPVTE